MILLLGVVTVDIGNWWVRKSHLQTQVDAAAFAGGPQFVGCFHDPDAANLAIASRALAYAGDTQRLGQLRPGAPGVDDELSGSDAHGRSCCAELGGLLEDR